MFKFIFLLLVSSSAFASDAWTTSDSYREATYLTLHALDWAQTRHIARNPSSWQELNSQLGQHPSVDRVDVYHVLTGLLHVTIAYNLPSEYRVPFQYITIGHRGNSVIRNFSLGLSARF